MFQAFLNLSKKECDEMTIDEYIDYDIILQNYLKIQANIVMPRI
jgi:hypothetical protein